MHISRLPRLVLCGVVLLILVEGGFFVSDAQAMPLFARRYGYSCDMCHTVVPRLNKFGYEFRRAGFRDPSDIGSAEDAIAEERETSDFNMANYMSARLQAAITWVNKDNATRGGGYEAGGNDFTQTNVEFKEFTLYPLTGAFLGHWAGESEISGSTDEIEVENAYARYVNGDADLFWEARLGVFHPFEGFGASDRPLSISRPLIQSTGTINGREDPNGWHPWGFDQAGIEAGINAHDTSFSVAMFNGLIENADDPAQGGKLKKDPASPTHNDKDFQLFFNQFFGDSGAAISAYYYDGSLSLGEATLVANDFRRAAVYGTIPVGKAQILGAYSWGEDKDQLTRVAANNTGWFVEADAILTERWGLGARYDSFDPSDLIAQNDIRAVSLFVNNSGNNGLQWIAQYTNKVREKGVGSPDQTENSLNIRLIYIW